MSVRIYDIKELKLEDEIIIIYNDNNPRVINYYKVIGKDARSLVIQNSKYGSRMLISVNDATFELHTVYKTDNIPPELQMRIITGLL